MANLNLSERGNGMTRAEAIKCMVEGKYVRHYNWPNGDYILLSDEGYFINADLEVQGDEK